MECFAKVVKSHSYFSKALYLRSLAGFWIRPSLNKYLLTFRVTSPYALFEICSDIFKSSSGIFRMLCNARILTALPYSEFCPYSAIFSSWNRQADIEIARLTLKSPGWHWQRNKQKLRSTLRLNFLYLKIIRFLHPRYHPKIKEDILKNVQKKKQVCLF